MTGEQYVDRYHRLPKELEQWVTRLVHNAGYRQFEIPRYTAVIDHSRITELRVMWAPGKQLRMVPDWDTILKPETPQGIAGIAHEMWHIYEVQTRGWVRTAWDYIGASLRWIKGKVLGDPRTFGAWHDARFERRAIAVEMAVRKVAALNPFRQQLHQSLLHKRLQGSWTPPPKHG